jgi:hypothetical protein
MHNYSSAPEKHPDVATGALSTYRAATVRTILGFLHWALVLQIRSEARPEMLREGGGVSFMLGACSMPAVIVSGLEALLFWLVW